MHTMSPALTQRRFYYSFLRCSVFIFFCCYSKVLLFCFFQVLLLFAQMVAMCVHMCGIITILLLSSYACVCECCYNYLCSCAGPVECLENNNVRSDTILKIPSLHEGSHTDEAPITDSSLCQTIFNCLRWRRTSKDCWNYVFNEYWCWNW